MTATGMYKLPYAYASLMGTTAIEISPCVDSLGEDNMLPFLGDDEMFYAVQFSFTENYCTPTVKENGILPVGLRALDELAAWGRDNLRTRPRSLPDELKSSIDTFLQAYCNVSPSLPMASCRNQPKSSVH